MKRLSDSTLAILGLGLMGGSLALALQECQGTVDRVIGMDRDPETLKAASAGGALSSVANKVGDWLGEADLIVLATPVRQILTLIRQIGPYLHPGALVFDLGSTKSVIVRAMGELPPSILAVGGHPMCGKETSGWAAADPALYRGKLFILSPTLRSTEETMDTAASLARAVGARPTRMEAERHDRIVAAVSHLPYFIAANLVAVVDEWANDEPDLWKVAASGFADTTRVGGSSVEMMIDILMTNREIIVDRLRETSRRQEELIQLLENGDEESLRARLQKASDRRRAWKEGSANV